MSNVLDCPEIACFEDIIGLSDTVCECYPANSYYNSYSCLYLDQAEGLNLKSIEALEDCATEENIWLLMAKAREKAIRRFISDVRSQMAVKHIQARTFFSGYIGKNGHTNLRTISQTYAGLRLRARQVVGGYIKIKAINTCFRNTGTIEVHLSNNNDGELTSYTLNTVAGKVCRNEIEPVILPLWDGRCDYLDYVLWYNYDALNKPYDTKVSCCGYTYKFDVENPYWKLKSNKLDGWGEWVMAGAFAENDTDLQNLPTCTSDHTNGLQLECEFYCDAARSFCFDEPNIHDNMFLTVAFAILHAAAQYLCIDLITTDKINRAALINVEQLEAVRQLHETKYKECLEYLTTNVDLRNTDCFLCRDKFPLYKGSL